MPRKGKSETTKSEILTSAVRLFQERGWGNVNIEDIVNEVGVTRGAFYHYFKSREELIFHVIVQMFMDENPFTIAVRKKGLNGLEKLRYALKLNIKMNSDPALAKDLQNVFDDPVIFKNHLLLAVNQGARFVEKLIAEGNEDGSLSVAYPRQVSESIIVLLNVWLDIDIFSVSYSEYTEKVNFMDSLLKLLGAPIFDDELLEGFLKFHKDYKSSDKKKKSKS